MIKVTFHNSRNCHSQDDIYRAREAAEAYLDARGVSAQEAYEAFRRDIEETGNVEGELAKIWSDAEYAAQVAATENWISPDDVFVEISA